jgi:hypothetical protein
MCDNDNYHEFSYDNNFTEAYDVEDVKESI